MTTNKEQKNVNTNEVVKVGSLFINKAEAVVAVVTAVEGDKITLVSSKGAEVVSAEKLNSAYKAAKVVEKTERVKPERKVLTEEEKAERAKATAEKRIARTNANNKRITDILQKLGLEEVEGRQNGYKVTSKHGEVTNRVFVKLGEGYGFEIQTKDDYIDIYVNRGHIDILKEAFVPFEIVKNGLCGTKDAHIKTTAEKAAITALCKATKASYRTPNTETLEGLSVEQAKTLKAEAKNAAKAK